MKKTLAKIILLLLLVLLLSVFLIRYPVSEIRAVGVFDLFSLDDLTSPQPTYLENVSLTSDQEGLKLKAAQINKQSRLEYTTSSFNPQSGGISFWLKPPTNFRETTVTCSFLKLKKDEQNYIQILKNSNNELVFKYVAENKEQILISRRIQDSYTDGRDANDTWAGEEWHPIAFSFNNLEGQQEGTILIDGFPEKTTLLESFSPALQYSLEIGPSTDPLYSENCSFLIDEIKVYQLGPNALEAENELVDLNAGAPSLISPQEVEAASLATLEFDYTINKEIYPGGGIRLIFKHAHDWQGLDANNVVVSCNNPSVTFNVSLISADAGSKIIQLTAEQSVLNKGDKINFSLQNLTAPRWSNENERFRFFEDTGRGFFFTVPTIPTISIKGKSLQNIILINPSTVIAGQPFRVTVRAEDKYRNLIEKYDRQVNFSSTDSQAVLPANYQFNPDSDTGYHLFQVTLNTPGFQRLTVTDGSLTNTGYPILVKEPGISSSNLYWGDIHFHSYFSDGRGLPEELYLYARDSALLDFAAVSDHLNAAESAYDSRFLDCSLNEQELTMLRETADSFYQPGIFTTFFAYEYRSMAEVPGYDSTSFPPDTQLDKVEKYPGDWNFYFLDSQSNPISFYHLTDVFNLLGNKEVLAIPHHMGASARPEMFYYYPRLKLTDPRYVPSIDVCRAPGRVELFGQAGLSLGYKLGFVSSSDDHTGHPGRNYWSESGEGYLAVWATELTRESIFEAIRQRRTYAATHRGIFLDFSMIDDFGIPYPMGSEINYKKNSANFAGKVASAGEIAKIEIIKGQIINDPGEASSFQPKIYDLSPQNCGLENRVCDYQFTDANVNEPGFENGALYYVRLTDNKNRQAWSSSIWLVKAASVPGDVNGDGAVDEIDYAGVIAHFGETGTPGTVIGDIYPIDVSDGVVDERDYATIINFFGT